MSFTLTAHPTVEPEQPSRPLRLCLRLTAIVGLTVVALLPLGYHYDVHTVVAYEIEHRLNEPKTPPVCTPTSWIVLPVAQETDVSDGTYIIRVVEEPCWTVEHGAGAVPVPELRDRYKMLVASGEWSISDAKGDIQSLLVSTDLAEEDVKVEVARLTGTPEWGEYQVWAANYGDDSTGEV